MNKKLNEIINEINEESSDADNLILNSIKKLNIILLNLLLEETRIRDKNGIKVLANDLRKIVNDMKEDLLNYTESHSEKYNNLMDFIDNVVIIDKDDFQYILDTYSNDETIKRIKNKLGNIDSKG